MNDTAKTGALVMVVLALVGFGIVVWYERMEECRRVHPLWYCVSE